MGVASFVTLALLSTTDDQAQRTDTSRAGLLPAPPARICGNAAVLGSGPASPPPGAIRVPAGNNARVNWARPGATYWFAPGVHTLGAGDYTQIQPGRGAVFVGAPGAILDGAHRNFYAFGGPHPTSGSATWRSGTSASAAATGTRAWSTRTRRRAGRSTTRS